MYTKLGRKNSELTVDTLLTWCHLPVHSTLLLYFLWIKKFRIYYLSLIYGFMWILYVLEYSRHVVVSAYFVHKLKVIIIGGKNEGLVFVPNFVWCLPHLLSEDSMKIKALFLTKSAYTDASKTLGSITSKFRLFARCFSFLWRYFNNFVVTALDECLFPLFCDSHLDIFSK